MAIFQPEKAPLTLLGVTSGNAVGLTKYGVNDQTGLGPNGADKFIEYTTTITISAQSVGDASVRASSGLGVGGQYNGVDVAIGDYLAIDSGTKVFKITAISAKTTTSVSLTFQDVNMIIARTFSNRINTINDGSSVVIFRASDAEDAVIALSQLGGFSGVEAISAIQNYFNINKPQQRFTFSPIDTGSLTVGDSVTIFGSGTGYYLNQATGSDPVIGTVSDIYGGNKVNVRTSGKVITNFTAPEKLTTGGIETTWYLSGSGDISNNVSNSPQYLQLTNPIPSSVTSTVANTTFDETQYNLIINGIEVISQDAGGGTLTTSEITSSINGSSYPSLTHTSASIIETGGGFASATTLGSAGSGGSAGTLGYNPLLAIVLQATAGPTGTYSSAPGEFSITAPNGITFSVRPIEADFVEASFGNVPCASATRIAIDINTAATAAGANVVATAPSANELVITGQGAGTLIITNTTNDAFSVATVGNGSGTGLPTGTFSAPAVEQFLKIFRNDGGDIIIGGNWYTSVNGAGIFGVGGTPPYLLQIQKVPIGLSSNTFPFTGSAQITGSLSITGSSIFSLNPNQTGDFFLIKSSSFTPLKINNDGIAVFGKIINALPTPTEGGVAYSGSNLYVGLE
jgi:hypothetical protein|tara:strand:+ start:828 stop:2711 length:1884 start_codon:yes stop_codon:yes gene_type:complete